MRLFTTFCLVGPCRGAAAPGGALAPTLGWLCLLVLLASASAQGRAVPLSARAEGVQVYAPHQRGGAPLRFVARGGEGPYTFYYRLNGGREQRLTTAGAVAEVRPSTAREGRYAYTLTGVRDGRGRRVELVGQQSLALVVGGGSAALAQTQFQKLVASDRTGGNLFGYSMAVSGNTLVVGAFLNQTDANGQDTLSAAGAVYVFTRSGGVWSQTQKLVATDREVNAQFGTSVAISDNVLVVGANQDPTDANGQNALPNAGAAYVFSQSGGQWSQTQKLVANDRAEGALFGHSMAISDNVLVVGAFRSQTDANGQNALPQAGAAYVFSQSGGQWSQTQKLVANDRAEGALFGNSVAVSGSTVVVGALVNATDASGQNALPQAGAAYVFSQSGGQWSQTQKLVANDRAASDFFGYSVAISGGTVVVGALVNATDASNQNPLTQAGAAYVFTRSDGVWSQTQKLVASDRAAGDWFGSSLVISGSALVVGAFRNSTDASGQNPLSAAGAAYVFRLSGGQWSQTQKLVANDRATGDELGRSVAVSDSTLVAGAYLNSTDANNQNPLPQAGVAYTFRLCDLLTVQALTAQTTCAGGTAGFSVRATGTNLTYQWYKDSVSPQNLLSGQTNATLTLTAVQTGDAGTYLVVVTDACQSTATQSTTLTVTPTTTIQSLTPSQAICGGQPFTVAVQANGQGLAYQWYRQVGCCVTQLIPGATTATATIPTQFLPGNLFVVVSGSCGHDTAFVTLTNKPPTLLRVTSLVSQVCEGGNLTLSVSGTGPAPLAYAWRKDDPAGPVLGTGTSLTIANARPADAGSYACTLTSECTTAQVNILVTVRFVRITTQPQSVTLCSGQTTLSVGVQAVGVNPTYQWRRNGTPISGATSASLTVQSSRPGTYTVEVRTACGNVVSDPATVGCGNPRLGAEEPTLVVVPNPTATGGEIRLRVGGMDNPVFSLTTSAGRSVGVLVKTDGSGEFVLTPKQPRELGAGVYAVRAQEGPARLTRRVLVVD